MIAGKLLEAEQYTDSLALLEEIAAFPSLAEKSRALVALFSGQASFGCVRLLLKRTILSLVKFSRLVCVCSQASVCTTRPATRLRSNINLRSN